MAISMAAGGVYRIEDRGAPIVLDADGCVGAADPQVVECRPDSGPSEPGMVVLLGDRDDTLRFSHPTILGAFGEEGDDALSNDADALTTLAGGLGDDTLVGGSRGDVLYGDASTERLGFTFTLLRETRFAGNDVLRGGGGRDNLLGGLGDDRLSGGTGGDVLEGDPGPAEIAAARPTRRGADAMAGGPGIDAAAFDFVAAGRPRSAPTLGVSFDGLANDGGRRERDNIRADVERAYSLSAAQLFPTGSGFLLSPFPAELRPRLGVGARIYRLSGRGTAGATSGLFEGTHFRVRESRPPGVPTEIQLPKGGFERCPGAAGLARPSGLPPRVIRRLRARARGNFRVIGRHLAATIRGTDWTITERCDGTLTKVRRGTVLVRDQRRRRTILVRAGESYLARAAR